MTRSRKSKSGRGGKGYAGEEQNPGVAETTLNRITQILINFRNAKDEVYTFEPDLTNQERALVHQVSRKMGMKSKSSGHNAQRRVSIYKVEQTQEVKRKENITTLAFSKDTHQILQDLFAHFPPHEEELSTGMPVSTGRHTDTRPRFGDDSFCKPLMSKEDIAKKLKLADKKNSTLGQIADQRSKLPIASFKDTITSTVESHQVVLIAGETGCGKTTQVPQFLLDYMWGKREPCKIVCTQPRRISAVSVAERISYERGETVGDNIGYKIRMESKGGKHSSVMFCTNGILLKILVENVVNTSNRRVMNDSQKCRPFDITHIIVDEIHERDRFSDFMLAILWDILPAYPHLRLILMSATIDAERFSEYFGGCPTIRVPGFMYPVKSFYLEDVLYILKSTDSSHVGSASSSVTRDTELTEDYRAALDDAINIAWSNDEFDPLLELVSSGITSRIFNYQHSLTGASPLMVFAGKGRVEDVCMLLSFGADCHLHAQDGTTALEWAQRECQDEVAEVIKQHLEDNLSKSTVKQELLQNYCSSVFPEFIDVILIERLLRKICMDSREGAILVFLPGWDAINKTRDMLLASEFFSDTNKFVILSLHSMVPAAEQKKVFRSPPHGSRKLILSTNIAETAVTIDDVVYVIDTGRMKEKSYDPYKNVSTLHSSWISKANAKQRAGRAGRCQAGICYHLYSKTQAAAMADFQVPEIKRMPIEELCLQVKILDPNCKVSDFLQKILDPPVSETMRNAIMVLQDIGALTIDETLTELGEKLGSLPVHPCTSKMLFFSILMNCLDPALTLACASDCKDPFILPMVPKEKKKALAAKAELASLYGGHSDQLMVIAAYDCWKRAKDKGQEFRFCSQYFVSSSTMNMLSHMRRQLQNELIKHGFIPEDVSMCSLNARDPGILNAILVAGLYPMVGKLLPPLKSGGRVFVETPSSVKVRLHPQSSNYKISDKMSQRQVIVMFDEITNGDGGMIIRYSTVVGPYALLLLATEMVVAPGMDNEDVQSDEEDEDMMSGDEEKQKLSARRHGDQIMSAPENNVTLVVDRWLTFNTTALDVAQIYCLRERLRAAVLFKVKYPNKILPPELGASMHAIACLLSYDGLSETLHTLYADSSSTPANHQKPKTVSKENTHHSNTPAHNELLPSPQVDAESSQATTQTHCAGFGGPGSGGKRRGRSSKRKRGSGPPLN